MMVDVFARNLKAAQGPASRRLALVCDVRRCNGSFARAVEPAQTGRRVSGRRRARIHQYDDVLAKAATGQKHIEGRRTLDNAYGGFAV